MTAIALDPVTDKQLQAVERMARAMAAQHAAIRAQARATLAVDPHDVAAQRASYTGARVTCGGKAGYIVRIGEFGAVVWFDGANSASQYLKLHTLEVVPA